MSANTLEWESAFRNSDGCLLVLVEIGVLLVKVQFMARAPDLNFIVPVDLHIIQISRTYAFLAFEQSQARSGA